jgi:hypothetical protein
MGRIIDKLLDQQIVHRRGMVLNLQTKLQSNSRILETSSASGGIWSDRREKCSVNDALAHEMRIVLHRAKRHAPVGFATVLQLKLSVRRNDRKLPHVRQNLSLNKKEVFTSLTVQTNPIATPVASNHDRDLSSAATNLQRSSEARDTYRHRSTLGRRSCCITSGSFLWISMSNMQ